jgi:hypothetical protein
LRAPFVESSGPTPLSDGLFSWAYVNEEFGKSNAEGAAGGTGISSLERVMRVIRLGGSMVTSEAAVLLEVLLEVEPA